MSKQRLSASIYRDEEASRNFIHYILICSMNMGSVMDCIFPPTKGPDDTADFWWKTFEKKCTKKYPCQVARKNIRTYALVERWLVGSCLTASSFSSSSELRREPGTDLEGSSSSTTSLDCMTPDCGDVS